MKMKLNLPRTNLEVQLQKTRNRRVSEANILQQVQEIFTQEAKKDERILEQLSSGNRSHSNNFNFDLLEADILISKRFAEIIVYAF